MRKRVLVTYKMPHEGYLELLEHCDVTFPEGETFTYDEVMAVIDQYDALLSMYDFPVDKALIDRGARLRIVSNYAAGFDNVDLAYCTARGIQVANTPGVGAEATADLAMGLMLAAARNISWCDRHMRSPAGLEWSLMGYLGVSLYGKRLGIIGLGRIGKAFARRAMASGMEVVYCNNLRRMCAEEEEALGVRHMELEELLRTADFVSLNCPHTPVNTHLIGERELAAMKPSAILINTARGPLVHEAALIDALKQGVIRGAALDVYEFGEEPTPELYALENIVLSPHIGTQTIDVRNDMTRVASRNILSFFSGDGPLHRVNTL